MRARAQMLLAIDVGNTNVVCGLYDGKKLLQFWRMETSQRKSADEYGIALKQMFEADGYSFKQVDDVIIATVVPSLTYTLQHFSEKYFKKTPIFVEPGIKTGLIVKYDNPKLLGADRIVNSVAAYESYKAPLIVIDFGTATTICAVSDKAEYLGGVIAPGVKISSEALFEKTAKLPRIELEVPKQIICRNTAECMQSGVLYGHIGMIEYIVDHMKKEIAKECKFEEGSKKITVIATGGLSGLIAEYTDVIDVVDKRLTLTGLELIYEKNR